MTGENDFRRLRTEVLASLGAGPAEVEELLAYNDNAFDRSGLDAPVTLPLPDEPHLGAWRRYEERAREVGTFEALAEALAQLRFPIAEGISDTDAYRAATRRGVDPSGLPEATGLELEDPEGLQLRLVPTPAGTVPVVVAATRADFESLVRAITERNEPRPVPESQGAAMIGGYNNWGRIRDYRRRWEEDHPGGDWSAEFKRLIPRKELYKDQFILLSSGPYSAVPAADLDLEESTWRQHSITIRTHHECAHYFTRRLFGSMRNRALDETLADYMGVVAAAGRYRADWFLRFLGLEDFPAYRQGGRLQNYRGEPPLSDAAFEVLQAVVVRAATHLERFDAELEGPHGSTHGDAVVLLALTGLTLEEMASAEAADRLASALEEARRLAGSNPQEH